MGGSFTFPFLRDHLSGTLFHEIWLKYFLYTQSRPDNNKLKTNVLGFEFNSPIGGESGIDLNGTNLAGLLSYFAHIEAGPVTPSKEFSLTNSKIITSDSITHTGIDESSGCM